jgi:farnesyl diphosphate synthase
MQALAFEVLTPPATSSPRRCRRACAACWRARRVAAAWPAARPSTSRSVGRQLDERALSDMHRRKTGALLRASVLMGARAARRRRANGKRWRRTAMPSASPSRSSTTSST